ncbi:DinB family protein [Allorhizocola rhizosphaerae]|uniref:DinB family protein n=1 Tax=Allorhizocola rhizosphaerae TaxID=1872709 RepID=UPI000E3D80BC|nr:DinB family protein [Allorhizocola rhizosphaerae]
MDTTVLRAAYSELIAEARLGGFGDPPPGQWSAQQVIAHVAANDELLAEATRQVLDGSGRAYYNHDAIDTARLDELIAEKGDVLAWLEETSARLCDLADRLPEEDQTMVHTQIIDGTHTRVDQPWPWPKALVVQAKVHLPAHLTQLIELRGQHDES